MLHPNSLRRLRDGLAGALAVLAAVATPLGGRAADPQPYTVVLAPTGDAALDAAAHDAATLISLRDSSPVGPFALLGRTRNDLQRLTAALHSFGYYDGTATAAVAGRPLDDPDLPAALDATPKGRSVEVKVTMQLGPLFHLRHVTLVGPVPPDAVAAFALTPGQPARAADVLAARDRLLKALRDSGHALATVAEPVATLVPAEQALDVSLQVDAGPRVDLGPITIEGLGRTNESFVRRRLLIHQGEQYNPDKIEAARQDLASVGVFSTVRITAADRVDPAGQLPMQVEVAESKLRTVTLGAAYSTDLGGSLTASWTNHNLFGNAEQLTLSAAATELGGTAARQPGYNLEAKLVFPDWLQRDQSLTLDALAVREYLLAYDRTAAIAGATVARKLDPDWTVSVGLSAEEAQIEQEDVSRTYTLLQVPLGVQYDSAHDLFNPTHGIRANASLTPTESLSDRDATFLIAQASASTYFDFAKLTGGDPGRSVLAVRGLVGGVEGAATFDIPPDQRFYAGGGGTVRGFRFQSIGPQFADGNPVGGTSVDAGSIEFRQRIGASYGAAAFVDAGQVGTSGVPFEGNVRVGAGVGARYYTSFGPLRVDFAIPLVKQPHSDAFEVYIGIGQAF
jgi:translocation and assembly module TamA